MSTHLPANSHLNPHSTAQIAGHPLHVMFVPFVIGFYTGALAADLAYVFGWRDVFFARGAMWLLGAGVVMSLPAATWDWWISLAKPPSRLFPMPGSTSAAM